MHLRNTKQTRTWLMAALWALFCLTILVYDWRFWAVNRLDADMASEQVLAELLSREGSVLSKDWYYSTELRVLNTQLVMAPLFRLFSDWHTVRVAGSCLLIVIYLIAWFFFARQSRLRYAGLFGAGLLLLPFSGLYRQYVLEGLYYIPHIAISFACLGCVLAFLRAERRGRCAAASVFCVLSFLAALGGPRQLFILHIPLTLAVLLLCWLDGGREGGTMKEIIHRALACPGGKLLGVCLAADAAALAGYAVNAKVLFETYHFQDQGYVKFSGLNLERLQWFVNAVLSSFGWQEGKVFSTALLYNLGAVALLVFCCVFSVRLVKGREHYPLAHRLIGTFFLMGLVCFALLYGFTNSGHSDRYLLPLAVLFVPLVEIALTDCAPKHKQDARIGVFCLAAVLLLRMGADYHEAATSVNDNYATAQFLVENGYENGYASFWDGNIMTELTNGRIHVWTLTPNSVPELRPWLQITEHLQSPPQGKVFFVISKWEAYGECQPTTEALAAAMPEQALIFEDDSHKIYGFESDEAMRELCGFAPFGE